MTKHADTGACSYNAECSEDKRLRTPDDGMVDLDCEGTRCSCQLQPTDRPGREPSTFHFTLEAPCTSIEQAEQLLVERCMVGMDLAR